MINLSSRIFAVIIIATMTLGLGVNVNAASSDQQLQQIVKQLQATPDNNVLREKIAKAAAAMHPPPPVPEAARRYLIQATTIQKHAAAPADYALAIEDYQKALLVAPWWSDAYFDLATALELAQRYPEAIENLKLSVMADPHGRGARAAQDKLYEVEAEQQKAASDKAEQDAAAAQNAQAERLVETFRGTWYMSYCGVGSDVAARANRGCTDSERAGTNWYNMTPAGGGPQSLFDFALPGDGTVKTSNWVGWAQCGIVVGIPQGSTFASIRWEERPADGPARPIYSEITDDGNWLLLSCNRPLHGADSNTAYRYVLFRRHPG